MSHSRYQTNLSPITNRFNFVNSEGNLYEVYFDKNSPIIPDEDIDEYAVYMGFTRVPPFQSFDKEKDYDPRVEVTIMYLIENFFKSNKRGVLVYVCSSQEKYARQRSITFRKWFSNSTLKDKFKHLPNKFGETYTGAIYSQKHPFSEKIEFVFSTYDPTHKFDPVEDLIEEEDDELTDIGDGDFYN